MAKKRSVMCPCPLHQHHLQPVSESCCKVGERSPGAPLLQAAWSRLGAMPGAEAAGQHNCQERKCKGISTGERKAQ